MTWTAFHWVWRLEAPLHVGMPPAGTLNRCRTYVPGRALWGAVTAEISRSRNADTFPDYGKLGGEIAGNCRFTYLFPAEKRGDKHLVWLPRFSDETRGDDRHRGRPGGKLRVWLPRFSDTQDLKWLCEGGQETLSDRAFRRRLLDSRPGTAIAPESDAALAGSLRETECINPWWRDADQRHEQAPVFLAGYVFLKNNYDSKELEALQILFVGGDTRYGLGKIRLEVWKKLPGGAAVFGQNVDLGKDNPEIHSDVVLGHALDGQPLGKDMRGARELLGGWEHDKLKAGTLAWAPGSFLKNEATWSLEDSGFWKL